MVFFQDIVSNGLFIGLAATLVMLVFMLIGSRIVRDPKINMLRILGQGVALVFKLKLKDRLIFIVGLIAHLVRGSILGLIFFSAGVYFNFPLHFITGAAFSILPWLAMMLLAMPKMGYGKWGNKLSKKLPTFSLIIHLIFGAFLGYFAGL